MGKQFDPDKLGKGAPKLLPEDLEGDTAILTVAEYDEQEVDDDEAPEGKRLAAWLLFEETGDKRLYLNKTMGTTLVERFGKSVDDWKGEKVPVESAKEKFGKNTFHKVRVVGNDEWDDVMGSSKPAAKRGAKKSAKKSARR